MNRLTPAVKYLIIINGIFFALSYLLQNSIDLHQYLGLFYFKSEYFQPYQFITHMFMHGRLGYGGGFHILFNMYALFLFGSILERVWGAKRFIIYYMFTGLGAAALHTAVNWYMLHDFYNAVQTFLISPEIENFKYLASNYSDYFRGINFSLNNGTDVSPQVIIDNWNTININSIRNYVDFALERSINIPTVGASGAVFGLLLAFGMMFPNIPLMLFFIPIPIKAKYFVIGYGVLELVNGLTNIPGDNIAHFAHLGGMIFGFILLKIWYKNNINQQKR
ncbi:MAG: rhomboid family intramembrane serine protease [Bacteroidales bacterium]|nr:rhomboid family intramembrane serine protease [Bacteroidales bacterium]